MDGICNVRSMYIVCNECLYAEGHGRDRTLLYRLCTIHDQERNKKIGQDGRMEVTKANAN